MKQVLRLSEEDWKSRSRDELISACTFFHTEESTETSCPSTAMDTGMVKLKPDIFLWKNN